MKNLKSCFLILVFCFVYSCSSDDANDNENGFTYNGTFYETNFMKSSSQSSPYHLNISNVLNHNLPEAHFGSFYLNSGTTIDDGPLIEGHYDMQGSAVSRFGINGYNFIHFQDNSDADEVHIASGYWFQDDTFVSGSVTINSITSNEDNAITDINLDYRFKWNSVTVKGHYHGEVVPDL